MVVDGWRRIARAGFTFLVVVLLCVAPARAADEEDEKGPDGGGVAPAHRLLKGFQRSGQYILVIDGEHDGDAWLYHSRLAAAYLIIKGFDEPLLISPRTGTVQVADADHMVQRVDGNIYFLETVPLADAGRFEFVGGEVRFTYDGKSAALRPTPPLVGLHGYDALVRHTPEFVREGERHDPDPAALAALEARQEPAEVLVVFGSWCPSCRRHLPEMLRLEKELQGSKIQFRYHGLPAPPGAWREPAFINTALKRLPAIVISARGRRVGALSGSQSANPAQQLARILN
jgi:thiol-disulfide isomerase/thioredoxin